MKEDVLVIVSPCYNDPETIRESVPIFISKLEELSKEGKISKDSFLQLVDDSSITDTWTEIEKLKKQFPTCKAIKNPCNLGEEKAYIEGINAAVEAADIIVTMDDDLQDDIDKIEEMLNLVENGADAVIAYRAKRPDDTALYCFFANLFYTIMRLVGSKIVPQSSQYRMLTKEAAKQLLNQKVKFLFLPAQVPLISGKIETIPYTRKKRITGKSGYNYLKLTGLALSAIIHYSTFRKQ